MIVPLHKQKAFLIWCYNFQVVFQNRLTSIGSYLNLESNNSLMIVAF